MRRSGPGLVLTAITALTLGAAAVLALGEKSRADREAAARDFQRLVGGLGLGPAVDLERCPFSFDPRLGRCCPETFHPIPGGSRFCPYHACSVFPYASSVPSAGEEVGRNADVP
jgi:hypothetical protein